MRDTHTEMSEYTDRQTDRHIHIHTYTWTETHMNTHSRAVTIFTCVPVVYDLMNSKMCRHSDTRAQTHPCFVVLGSRFSVARYHPGSRPHLSCLCIFFSRSFKLSHTTLSYLVSEPIFSLSFLEWSAMQCLRFPMLKTCILFLCTGSVRPPRREYCLFRSRALDLSLSSSVSLSLSLDMRLLCQVPIARPGENIVVQIKGIDNEENINVGFVLSYPNYPTRRTRVSVESVALVCYVCERESILLCLFC